MMETMTKWRLFELIARAAHEVNRSYCETMGDTSQVPWDQAPDWQKRSCVLGVRGVIEKHNNPEQSHQSWLEEKRRDGWTYGPVKDAEKKTHPCFLPYPELPPNQRVKDTLYIGVIRQLLNAWLSGPGFHVVDYQWSTDGLVIVDFSAIPDGDPPSYMTT